jgi:hypothetical protein
MVSGTEQVKEINIWSTIYPKKFIDTFKGKKQGNILNLLGSISILGESKTPDMAKFVISHGKPKGYVSELRSRDYSLLQSEYYRLLTGRSIKTHGGKKIVDEFKEPKKNPNPVKLGYAILTGKPKSTKGIPTSQYFLTLKGFFLIVGYDLNFSELRSMIANASKVSIFFCFIKKMLDANSIEFVIEIFLKPIQKVLLRTDIFHGGSMDFYFGNIADAISESLSKKMKTVYENRKQSILDKPDSYFSEKISSEYMQLHSTQTFPELISLKKRDELQDVDDIIHHFRMEGIESLMDNVFYSINPREDWYESLIDYFYPSKESKSFFLEFGYNSEKYLMNKVMQSIYLTYTYFDYGLLKYTPKKLPRSKEWKRHQKFKKPDKAFLKKYGSKFKPKPDFDLTNLY